MSSMTEDKTYNGWTNYPTWNVNLWLSNDEGTYNYVRESIFGSAYDPADCEKPARIDAADTIKTIVRDELAPDLGASFAADLLGYALDQVNWLEIADAWLED